MTFPIPREQTQGFAEELLKIAAAQLSYRHLKGSEDDVELARGIPYTARLPKTEAKKIEALLRLTDPEKGKAPKFLGYRNVAVHEKAMGDIEALGFTPTHIATPLPGEAPLTVSWRSGKLHAHKAGPIYLVHQDDVDPKASRFGYLSPVGILHGIKEGVPSMIKRIKERQPLVKIHEAVKEETRQAIKPLKEAITMEIKK